MSWNRSNILAENKQRSIDLSINGLKLWQKAARRASSMTPEHNFSIFISKVNSNPKKKLPQKSNSSILSHLFSLFQPAISVVRKQIESKMSSHSHTLPDKKPQNRTNFKSSVRKASATLYSGSPSRQLGYLIDRIDRNAQKSKSRSVLSPSPLLIKKNSRDFFVIYPNIYLSL